MFIPKFQNRICVDCGKKIPNATGNQLYCDECRLARIKKRGYRSTSFELTAKANKVIEQVDKKLRAEATTWNKEDGLEELKEKFPDLFEEIYE